MTHFEAETKWELLDGDSVRWGGVEGRGGEAGEGSVKWKCERERDKKRKRKKQEGQ